MAKKKQGSASKRSAVAAIVIVAVAAGGYYAMKQTGGKPGHEPDDWENLLAAARQGGEWNGHRLNLDTPVVGVDWWDAVAYSAWKKGRLQPCSSGLGPHRSGDGRPFGPRRAQHGGLGQ